MGDKQKKKKTSKELKAENHAKLMGEKSGKIVSINKNNTTTEKDKKAA